MNVLLSDPVAKKSTPPDPVPTPASPAQSSTRVDRERLRKANIVAKMRGLSLYDYIHEKLESVETDFDALFRQGSARKPTTPET